MNGMMIWLVAILPWLVLCGAGVCIVMALASRRRVPPGEDRLLDGIDRIETRLDALSARLERLEAREDRLLEESPGDRATSDG